MDYKFYENEFGGNLIPPNKFKRFMSKAELFLENATGGREIPEEYTQKASLALCELAEIFMKRDSSKGVKSENTDGYSVSYDNSDFSLEMNEILNLYFGDSDLLFKGEYLC